MVSVDIGRPAPRWTSRGQIRESGWPDTPRGVKSSSNNCGGWMRMACCVKAYLEHGINLRAGGVM